MISAPSCKRVLDFGAAAFGLVLSAPVFLIAGLAVASTSPGPILFNQMRVGRNGELFSIRKFRTMYENDRDNSLSASNDPRITPVGAVLRRTKLDELPQLLNVLVGDMSLVGPRPELPRFVAQWPASARSKILRFRPGITDPASIVFRDEASILEKAPDPELHYTEVLLPAKVQMYVEYVDNWSFRTDIALIMRTIRAVVVHDEGWRPTSA